MNIPFKSNSVFTDCVVLSSIEGTAVKILNTDFDGTLHVVESIWDWEGLE